ncbi:Fn3_PAP domain-containing protein [Pseudomonas sp. IT-P2]
MLSPGSLDYIQEIKSNPPYAIAECTINFADGSVGSYTNAYAFRSSPPAVLITDANGINYWRDVSQAVYALVRFHSPDGPMYTQTMNAQSDAAIYRRPWKGYVQQHTGEL